EAIHNLHLADVACRVEQIENRELEDRVVQPLRLHLGHRDLWDEGGALRGLRVRGVEAVFVFDEYHCVKFTSSALCAWRGLCGDCNQIRTSQSVRRLSLTAYACASLH